MKKLLFVTIAGLLLAGCGSTGPYTAYLYYCGSQAAFTTSYNQGYGVIQNNGNFQKVCGGSATPAGVGTMYQAVNNTSCGFYVNANGAPVSPEEQLSGSWTLCP